MDIIEMIRDIFRLCNYQCTTAVSTAWPLYRPQFSIQGIITQELSSLQTRISGSRLPAPCLPAPCLPFFPNTECIIKSFRFPTIIPKSNPKAHSKTNPAPSLTNAPTPFRPRLRSAAHPQQPSHHRPKNLVSPPTINLSSPRIYSPGNASTTEYQYSPTSTLTSPRPCARSTPAKRSTTSLSVGPSASTMSVTVTRHSSASREVPFRATSMFSHAVRASSFRKRCGWGRVFTHSYQRRGWELEGVRMPWRVGKRGSGERGSGL